MNQDFSEFEVVAMALDMATIAVYTVFITVN
jgi:hypothetical protein